MHPHAPMGRILHPLHIGWNFEPSLSLSHSYTNLIEACEPKKKHEESLLERFHTRMVPMLAIPSHFIPSHEWSFFPSNHSFVPIGLGIDRFPRDPLFDRRRVSSRKKDRELSRTKQESKEGDDLFFSFSKARAVGKKRKRSVESLHSSLPSGKGTWCRFG